jgi:predicted RNA-binding Zn-ribbon protein involved in translation (DUF1610 family)
MQTIAIHAWCPRCGAYRRLKRVSQAGYRCEQCGHPKARRCPIVKRETKP